jgi:Lrp/AsnC family transcriptional regulator
MAKVVLDSIDIKILKVIQNDVSTPIVEIAKMVGLSQTPCWKRIQKLEQSGVINSRVAILNPEMLGLGLTVYISIISGEHSDVWLKKFTSEISKFPEVVEFYRLAGEVDYMLKALFPEIRDFDEFYKRLISIAPMKKVTSYFSMERIKCTTEVPLEQLRK